MTGESAKRSRYYTPNEVALHNTPNDLWVSFLGKVYDLTVLVTNNKGNELIAPILAVAGQDISHWFNSRTGDIKTHVDAEKGITKYYCPHGRFLHVPPAEPRSDYSTDFGRPWWRDAKYEIGTLTSKARRLRLINTLTSQQHMIEVCKEEKLFEILARYKAYNNHAESYTWKYHCNPLNMSTTLEANGITDEDLELEELSMDPESWTPAIHLYYNDDHTVG